MGREHSLWLQRSEGAFVEEDCGFQREMALQQKEEHSKEERPLAGWERLAQGFIFNLMTWEPFGSF